MHLRSGRRVRFRFVKGACSESRRFTKRTYAGCERAKVLLRQHFRNKNRTVISARFLVGIKTEPRTAGLQNRFV